MPTPPTNQPTASRVLRVISGVLWTLRPPFARLRSIVDIARAPGPPPPRRIPARAPTGCCRDRYGGPGSQLVDVRFSRDWHDYLACGMQYIVVTVDGRGTGFKGRRVRNPVKGNLGFYETEDQIAAAKCVLFSSFLFYFFLLSFSPSFFLGWRGCASGRSRSARARRALGGCVADSGVNADSRAVRRRSVFCLSSHLAGGASCIMHYDLRRRPGLGHARAARVPCPWGWFWLVCTAGWA